MELKLVHNQSKYFEYIRVLRTHPQNSHGFIEQVEITPAEQSAYMKKHKKCYFVCLDGQQPVGYVGVVDGDIRICTDPMHKNKGVGKFMLSEIKKKYPNSSAKIIKSNVSSLSMFLKCGYKIVDEDNNLYYLINGDE